MADVRTVYEIAVDKGSASRELTNLTRDFDSFGRKVSGITATFAKFGPAISAAFAIGGTAAAAFTRSAINQIDSLNRLAKTAGIGAEAFSSLAYAADLADVSNESLAQAMQKLGRNMFEAATGGKEAAEAFQRVGINVKDSAGNLRSVDQVFTEIAGKLSQLPDGAAKSALAMQYFSRSGAQLVPLLNEGADGIARMREEAAQLGVTFTDEAGKAADDFNDNLTRLGKAADGLGVTLAGQVLPSLVDITNAAVEGAKEFGALGAAYAALRESFALGFERFGTEDLEDKREKLDDLIDRLKYLRGEGFTGAIDKIFNDFKGNDRAAEIAAVTAEINKLNEEIVAIQKAAEADALAPKPKSAAPTSTAGLLGASDADADKAAKAAEKAAARAVAAFQRESDAVRAFMQDYAREREAEHVRMLDQARERETALRQAVETPQERGLRELDEYVKVFGANSEEYGRKAVQVFEEINTEIESTNEAAQDLALTMTSAFSDAIVSGASLSEVLKGVGRDLLQIGLRETLLKPGQQLLEQFFTSGAGSGLVSGARDFFGGLFSNDRGGLYKVGGSSGEHPVAFTARAGEYVAVGTGAQQGGGWTINVVNNAGAQVSPRVNPDTRTIDISVDAALARRINSGASARTTGLVPALAAR